MNAVLIAKIHGIFAVTAEQWNNAHVCALQTADAQRDVKQPQDRLDWMRLGLCVLVCAREIVEGAGHCIIPTEDYFSL